MSELYGYLAQQFTVYGQHIHIGCPDGDQAIRLAHFLARYIPHFIALSAASPYYQGVDTLFQSSRLTSVNAFPLSGTLPCVTDWAGFNDYFVRMQQLGIVASMKDFYWDVRPKPEYGTVEIRVCDTPLDLLTPVLLAAYAQMLARECMESGWQAIHSDNYLAYSYNRFQACRFGFEGLILNPADNGQMSLQQDLVTTLTRLEPQAAALDCEAERQQLLARALARDNPSRQLRALYDQSGSLNDLVRRQSAVWMRDTATL